MSETQVDSTLKEVVEAFLQALIANGRSPRTLYTYGKDCEQIIAFFGPEKKLINLLPAHIARFNKSDVLLKMPKDGRLRAVKTVEKTKRVLRLFLNWANEHGYIEGVPLPKKSTS